MMAYAVEGDQARDATAANLRRTGGASVRQFIHETLPRRVVYGSGAVEQLADEAAALDLKRLLVISGGAAAGAGSQAAEILGERTAARFGHIRQHAPEELVAEAVAAAKEAGADGLCSAGGGSATGLAKAVAVELDLPIIAIPTTYSGSEMTPIYGVTGEHKRTGRDRRAQPRVVVYDSDLTAALPPRVVASSGLNALAHAVAVLLTSDGDPIAQLHAEEAARRLMTALPLAVNPAEPAARDNTMFGAFLAAGALATLGAPGWHHRLCHIIGGTHRLVHADVHAVLLPRTIAFDHDRGAPGIAHLAAALGTSDPGGAVAALARDVGAPASLAELGLGPDALPGLVDRVGAELFPHSSVDRRRVEQLLSDAFAGRPAAPDAARHSSTQHPAS